MKTASFPSLRVDPELRAAAEAVLLDGESLSGFAERSIRDAIARRQAQQAFIARGLASRDEARSSSRYVTSAEVMTRLEEKLARAKSLSAPKGRARA